MKNETKREALQILANAPTIAAKARPQAAADPTGKAAAFFVPCKMGL